MPAPLAKGLIISLSVLFAAGLAVYENPQVRQWVDTSRRKIAIALHSLGDEITPPSNPQYSEPDASTREDESPEAVVRRWKARQEILERGRMMEERRKSKQEATTGKMKSFDDLVDRDGALKREEQAEATARTTAAQPEAESSASGLHKRNTENAGVVLGATLANPFSDEWTTDTYSVTSDNTTTNRSSYTAENPPPVPPKTPTSDDIPTQQLPSSPSTHPSPSSPSTLFSYNATPSPHTAFNIPALSGPSSPPTQPAVDTNTPPPVPPKLPLHTQPNILIDTDGLSTHPSEQLIDLTPTTSASSTLPTSPNVEPTNQRQPSSNYWSVHEWAENTAPSFYSPPQSVASLQRENETFENGSGSGGDVARREGSESDLDVVSELSESERGISTPGSWSEVGSVVSEEF